MLCVVNVKLAQLEAVYPYKTNWEVDIATSKCIQMSITQHVNVRSSQEGTMWSPIQKNQPAAYPSL